jgi:hypothetical protein
MGDIFDQAAKKPAPDIFDRASQMTQLSQDKNFLAANSEDKINYLSSQDPDFAKASREDQLGYIGHLTGKPTQPTQIPTQMANDRLLRGVGTAPATIGAAPTGAGAWLNNAESDLLHGSENTWVGKILHAAGANPNGLEAGVSPAVAQEMGSVPLGLVHAAQGVVETPEHPIAGPLKVASGALQAASLPLSFVAPETQALKEASTASQARQALLPTTEEAGKLFQPIEAAAKNVPVKTDPARAIAEEANKYAQSGATMPKVLKNFLKRTEASPASFPFPAEPPTPMLYPEGRLFAQNSGRLSVTDQMAANPNMQRLVGRFAEALKDANRAAAEEVGMGAEYDKAMKQYAGAANRAKMLQNLKDVAQSSVAKYLLEGVGAGVAGAGMYKLLSKK